MRPNPISPLIRLQNAKTILKGFPSLIADLNRQISPMFALGFNGAGDDSWVLGPFPSPARITSITYVSSLVPAPTRYFTLHISTDATAAIIYPTDQNLIDPVSPTQWWVPGLQAITVHMSLAVQPQHWYIKLQRFKGGSATFQLTVSIQIRLVD